MGNQTAVIGKVIHAIGKCINLSFAQSTADRDPLDHALMTSLLIFNFCFFFVFTACQSSISSKNYHFYMVFESSCKPLNLFKKGRRTSNFKVFVFNILVETVALSIFSENCDGQPFIAHTI